MNTPDPIRTRKLSIARPGQYWGGGPPGKPFGCRWLFVLTQACETKVETNVFSAECLLRSTPKPHTRRRRAISRSSSFCFICCYPRGYATLSSSAMPEATSERGRSKLRALSPHRKIDVKRELSVESVSVFTLIRTDTTLDHSQKAEKV